MHAFWCPHVSHFKLLKIWELMGTRIPIFRLAENTWSQMLVLNGTHSQLFVLLSFFDESQFIVVIKQTKVWNNLMCVGIKSALGSKSWNCRASLQRRSSTFYACIDYVLFSLLQRDKSRILSFWVGWQSLQTNLLGTQRRSLIFFEDNFSPFFTTIRLIGFFEKPSFDSTHSRVSTTTIELLKHNILCSINIVA